MTKCGIVIEVNGVSAQIEQPFTAAEVLRVGGIVVQGIVGQGIVIGVDGGRASRFDPSTPVVFEETARPVFRTFRGGAQRLHVDGLRWDRGVPAMSVSDVRAIGRMHAAVTLELEGQVGSPRQRSWSTSLPKPRSACERARSATVAPAG